MAKIYVSSSWRNFPHPGVVGILRAAGHDVYDFRNPPGRTGFAWAQIDPMWTDWDPYEFRGHLFGSPIADAGFASDFDAMKWADVCILVLPCGRSAHLEAGWFVGAGKKVFVYYPPGESQQEPELMYKFFDGIICPGELHGFAAGLDKVIFEKPQSFP